MYSEVDRFRCGTCHEVLKMLDQTFGEELKNLRIAVQEYGATNPELSVDEHEAYRRMQKESRQRRKTMREIAEAILLGDDLRRHSS